MQLSTLLNALHPVEVIGRSDIEINSIQFDSRLVGVGDLFVAQSGTSVDGHTFITRCISQGAVAIVLSNRDFLPSDEKVTYILVKDTNEALGLLACEWYGNPSKHLTLVGVTGTNGKTTIATLLYKLTRGMGEKAGLLSTVVNYVDDEAVPSTHTTPDALALNALLARMVEAGCRYAFMEVSSHSIAQARVAGLDFDGAIFTNLTRDHIDYHKTFDNYHDTTV